MNRRVSAFALAAAVACVFNTLLAWAKDAWAPLKTYMGLLTGHHWVTHGIADLIVFFGTGLIFLRSPAVTRMNLDRAASILIWCVAASGLGLLAWYLVF
ncbi:MAG TPA: hypothetical protein VHC90_20390 [Bryobacteraceae bacterium]|nr:hypothetical protein [Bryobacteraceae bacterium]